MSVKLLNQTMEDGSRYFYGFPVTTSIGIVLKHLQKLNSFQGPNARRTEIDMFYAIEGSIDFTFCGYPFELGNWWGDYWFISKDVNCPKEILLEIAEHFEKFLEK